MSSSEAPMPARVFRNTGAHEGWREFFSPESGAMRYLTYARLVFGQKVKRHALQTGEREWVVFCIRGPVTVSADGQSLTLNVHDMLYLPRDTEAVIEGMPGTDVVFGGCPAHTRTSVQLVRHEDIRDNPEFFFDVGTAEMGTKRRIFNMVGHNVKASRLLAGWTVGQPTAWTSWPPHEHNTSKEEFYLFFDMPDPAFSVQFVYTSPDAIEFREIVRDGDCVSIPTGYHPTAAAPGFSSVFLWVMAAFDPAKDRDFKHGITIQQDYSNVKFV